MKELILSKQAVKDVILRFEIGYDGTFDYYNFKLKKPTVPDWQNTQSGVTIGIGYDCGYNNEKEIESTWSKYLAKKDIEFLIGSSGKRSRRAHDYLIDSAYKMNVDIDSALEVFYNTTLPRFSKQALSIYPNLCNIGAVDATVIVGLVYNRGTSLTGARRTEMAQLFKAIENDDDKKMALIIRQMKRHWRNGLVKRREAEAALIELIDKPITEEDNLIITV